jgi:hypothetical protein
MRSRSRRPTHCTGWRAVHAIVRFPEAFIQSGVGTRFMFTSQ